MDGLAGESLAVSHWTRVEFSSLLARRVRMGHLDLPAAKRADEQFETIVQESFRVFLPRETDFDLAKTYLSTRETSLRAGDALHLAIARNHRAERIYSLDKGMIAAGELLGLQMRALV